MGNDKKRKPTPPNVKSESVEMAKTVLDSTEKVNAHSAAAQKEAVDPMVAFGNLVDLYKTKTAVKGLQVMEKQLNKELAEDEQSEQTSSATPLKAGDNRNQNATTPIAQILPLLSEDQRGNLVQSLMASLLESKDSDVVYDLLAGQNPGAKRLLSSMKPQQKPAQPANDFESMSNTMMNFMRMMGLGSVMKSSEESGSLQNMMNMFTFFQQMMGGPNKGDSNAELIRELGSMTRVISEGNQTLLRAISDGQNNTLSALKEVLVARPQEGSSSAELLKSIYETSMANQGKLLEQQLTNNQNQLTEKEAFWQTQFKFQADQMEQLKQTLSNVVNRPTGGTDPRLLNELLQGFQELKRQGLLNQNVDKEIELKKIETDGELKKLEITTGARNTSQMANASNIASVIGLVSTILDKNRPAATPIQANPAKPSGATSKMAGIPLPPAGMMPIKGVS